MKNIFDFTKDKDDEFEKSSIYKIECNSCNNVYIGKTKRSLLKRFKEHIYAIKIWESRQIGGGFTLHRQ